MKRQVAWWLVVSLSMGGTAWAQDIKTSVASQVPPASCPLGLLAYPIDLWLASSPEMQASTCNSAARVAKIYADRDAARVAKGRPRSYNLGMTGLFFTAVGAAMILPYGEEYHVVGQTYCVSNNYHDVDRGGCGQPLGMKQAGAITMAAGVAMMLVGFHRVSVEASPSSVTVTKTVEWGSSRGN